MGTRPRKLGGEQSPGEPKEGPPDAPDAADAQEEAEEGVEADDLGPDAVVEGEGHGAPLPPLDKVSPRHVAYVRGLLSKFGVSPSYEYEDLVQEVLIQASRSLDSPLEPRALLFGITRHLVFRWLAKRDNERLAVQMHLEDTDPDRLMPDAEEMWRGAERVHAVHVAIDELPEIFRDVFVRCEIDEVPMPDVARELGIPINTGYTRLHLARARFQEALKRYMARKRIGKDDLAVPIAIASAAGEAGNVSKRLAPKSIRQPPAAADAASLAHRLGGFARWHILAANAILVATAVSAIWTAPVGPKPAPSTEPTALPEPRRPSPDPDVAPVKSGSELAPPIVPTAPTNDDFVSVPGAPDDGSGPNSPARLLLARGKSEGTWARQIVGLARAGNSADAASQAATFRKAFPRSTYLPQIDSALEKGREE